MTTSKTTRQILLRVPIVLTLFTFAVTSWPAAAVPPTVVNYQGVLRDNNDQPLSGTYDIVFRFMDAAAAGTEIMRDSHTAPTGNAVTVSGGLFSVGLGSGTIADGTGPGAYTSLDTVFHDYGSVWLEVIVGAETLTPRTRVQSAAYALNATNAVSATSATTASNATSLGSLPSSYYMTVGPEAQTKTGALTLQYGYNSGSSSVLNVIAQAGYDAITTSSINGPYTSTCAIGDNYTPLSCSGYNQGAYFSDGSPWYSYATIPSLTSGIVAWGSLQGGVFNNFASGAYANVGVSSYKIVGSGSVSFVQNHPTDPAKVIVYAAPEGDEVAVYTRGSGRLVNGEAHVALGETFALVANPDIGLTATVTPRGEVVPLAVIAETTRELVVRGPAGSSAAFDYAVWGLRIGFEEQSIVQPRTRDSKIPGMGEHEAFFVAEPSLRSFTALARFKKSEANAFGATASDFSKADKLRDAVGVFGYKDAAQIAAEHKTQKDSAARPSPAETAIAPVRPAAPAPSPQPAVPPFPANAVSVPVAEGVEAGEVLANDPMRPGELRQASVAADPGVIGIVAGDTGASWRGTAPIALAGSIALCKVDATTGPIAPNDLLVASPTRGFAMRAGDNPKQGTVVAKALEPLETGMGTIRVLVMSR